MDTLKTVTRVSGAPMTEGKNEQDIHAMWRGRKALGRLPRDGGSIATNGVTRWRMIC